MAQLHNKISHRELKEKIKDDTTPRTTISFYKYFKIDTPRPFRDDLYFHLNNLGVLGRIYIAHEGINAQINVPTANLESFKKYISSLEPFRDLRLNIAVEERGSSFFVLTIKVREKIVADGLNDAEFNPSHVGTYLKAKDFNDLAEKKETVIIDMRNHYEYEVGHFKNAIEIPSDTFREQLPMAVEMFEKEKDKNIIMYCTGGIRCEKASAYLRHKGFQNVYHVEGGIIHYAKQIKEQNLENKFIGKNFVFDDRLGERISKDIIAHCHQCGKPCDTHTNCSNDGCHLLFIQCEDCARQMEGCCTTECLNILHLPDEERKKLRQGIDKGQMIFNKSKDVILERFGKRDTASS